MLNLPLTQLAQIVSNGGGIEIDCARLRQPEIIQLAAHAGASGAKLVVKNSANHLSMTEIVQIAANGKGNVFFEG